VVDLSQGALGEYCRHGFVHGGGFYAAGLVTHYVLFILDLAPRTVKIAGITAHPHEAWMVQMARNLTDAGEPFLRHTRFLIMDRDTKYIIRSLPRGTDSGADRADPTAAALTQFERVRGKIRTLSEDGVYRADGLLQQIIA
jgi:hypothetical protein